MTIASTPVQTVDSSVLAAEFGGSSAASVDVMIGVGLIKDSEAVFFQYVGDDKKQALMQANGKPVTSIYPVNITGVAITEPIGEFNQIKLNLFLRTQAGTNVMLTSGITTMWSQCIMTCLMGLYSQNALNSLIKLDTYKGKSSKGACFASMYNNGNKVTSNAMYQDLADARQSRNYEEVERLQRNAIELISAALSEAGPVLQDAPVVTEVVIEQANDF